MSSTSASASVNRSLATPPWFKTSGEILDELVHLQDIFRLLTRQEYQPSLALPSIHHLITNEDIKVQLVSYNIRPLDQALMETAWYYERTVIPRLQEEVREYFQLPASIEEEEESESEELEDPRIVYRYPNPHLPLPTMEQANQRFQDAFVEMRLSLLQDFHIYDVLEAYIQDLLQYHEISLECYEEKLAIIMNLATRVRAKSPTNKNVQRFGREFEEEHQAHIKRFRENLTIHLLQDEKTRAYLPFMSLYQKAMELKTLLMYRSSELLYLPTHIRYLEEDFLSA